MVKSCCRVLIWRKEFKSSRYEEGWKSVRQPAPFEDCLFRWIATLLCCCWGLPSQSNDPQDKTNYIFTETDFLFHQDLFVFLILVSYWKGQFFPLPSFDMSLSWVTRFTFPNKSFINSLSNWFVPCKSEKNELQIQKKTCIWQANIVLYFFIRLQQIDFSGGFPCMLLVVFSILRLWLVVHRCFCSCSLHPLFSFHYQGSITTKFLHIVWYWGVFFTMHPTSQHWVYVYYPINKSNEKRILERSPCIWTLSPPLIGKRT